MCVVCLYFRTTRQPKQTVTSGATWWCSCKPGGANRKQDCTGIKNTSSYFYYRKTGNIWKRLSRFQKVAMSLFVKTLLKHYSDFHHIRENKGVDIGFFFLHRKKKRQENNCDVTRSKLKKPPQSSRDKALVPERLLVSRQRNKFKYFNHSVKREVFQHSPEVNLSFTMWVAFME